MRNCGATPRSVITPSHANGGAAKTLPHLQKAAVTAPGLSRSQRAQRNRAWTNDPKLATFGAMSQPKPFSAAEVIEIANKLGVSRGSLQTQLRLAESEGEVDAEPMLNAMRVLLSILEQAEAAK